MSHVRRYKAIVIGGGMAGLSACLKLIEKGITDFLLVEATGRLGGRINTVEHKNSFIELGAQWIRGTHGNPIYELANILDLVDQRAQTDFGEIMYYATQDGTQVDEKFADKIYEKIEYIFDNLDDQIENELDDNCDQSIKFLLDDCFDHVVKRLRTDGEHDGIDMELVKAIYNARLNDEKFNNGCECLSELSALGWNEYEDFDGDEFTNLKSGLQKLIDYFVAQIPEGSVKLSEIVEKVDWSLIDDPLSPIEVTTFNIHKKARITYKADTVLCTIPLGYLKACRQSLFHPDLPRDKIDAIERLGFGLVDKIFLVYEKPLFPSDVQGLQIFWRDDLKFELSELTVRKWNLHSDKFCKAFENFNVLPLHPEVLYGFVVGEDAAFIEGLDDECLLDVVHEVFTKCFPQLKLPRASHVYRSKWHKNQFIKGSFSYIKMGSSIEHTKTLFKPLNNKLYFAGEATHYKYSGTMHGAYASGRLAAGKMYEALQLYQ